MHNANEVMLGHVPSSDKVVENFAGDPSVLDAGIAVRLKSDNTLSTTSSDGGFLGVSVGQSLDDTLKVAVCRVGNDVPVQLTDEGEYSELEVGDLTITAKEKGEDGDDITIALVDDADAGEETVEVDGTDIVVHMEDGVSTAQQIADALEASDDAMALIGVTIAEGEESTAQDAAAADNLADGADSYPYAIIGTAVKISNSTGKAASSGTTSSAIYKSEALDGINAFGATKKVAKVDMAGGL